MYFRLQHIYVDFIIIILKVLLMTILVAMVLWLCIVCFFREARANVYFYFFAM